ncbi:hypothetical protein [Pyrobaculum ferrireducens]|uniref:Uncharacterized protein n=1 Tax=Pyrobaculum ferrireducens TaxID=1104324 RepID=G7VAP0_9CREN|nr:hypothetical protein [Pyrobaculum ferrireducens]AET32279.1 hypothetical protein P186_0837 [Pyrobaculum ferrireducens]
MCVATPINKTLNDTESICLFWVGSPPGFVRLGRLVKLAKSGDSYAPVFEAGTLPKLTISGIRGAGASGPSTGDTSTISTATAPARSDAAYMRQLARCEVQQMA